MALAATPYAADEKYTALHCLACFLMATGAADAQAYWLTSRQIAVGESNVVSGGRRVWWMVRMKTKPGEPTYYVSVDPGECRLTRPRADEGIVVPLDDLEDEGAHLDVVAAAFIDELSNSAFHSSLDADALLQKSRVLLARMHQGRNVSDHGIAILRAASRHIDERQQDVPQGHFVELYRQCVLDCEVDAGHYAAAELLIRLQMRVAHWIDGDPYANPLGYLRAFLAQIDGRTRRAAADFLTAHGKDAFKQGRKTLQAALDCQSLVAHQVQIVRSVFYFSTAHIVAELLAAPGMAAGAALEYTAILAEESVVCARAGLLSGTDFFLRHPDAFVADIAKDLAKGKRAQLSRLCSPTWPTFPTFFARSLIASAGSLQPGPLAAEGLAELERLRKDLAVPVASPLATFFERDWLTRCLLRGYRATRDDENAERMSLHLAASAIIAAQLQKGGRP